MHPYDILIISIYLIFTISLSIYVSKESSSSIDSYFLSRRSSSWWLLGTSMVATTLSIDTPLVIIGWIYTAGTWKNWFWWSFLFTHCLIIFYFSKYWKRIGVLTDNELIDYRYSGNASRILKLFKAFYFSVFFNLIISAWIISAFIKIFTVIIGDNTFILLLISTLTAMFYTTLGGIRGVMINDFIQYFIAFAGSIILAFFIINSDQIGGFGNYFEIVKSLPSDKTSFIPNIFNYDDFLTFIAYITVVWWTSHNADGGGYIIQRLCSAKTERDGALGTVWFILNHYVLRLMPWLFIGFASLIIFQTSNISDSEKIFPIMIKNYLTPGFKGLILIALISAYMSTISTQVNWGSSYIVNDICKYFLKVKSEKKLVTIGRIFSVVFLTIALIIGLSIDNIGKVWIFLWSVSSGLGFFLLARWFYWRINAWSEIVSILTSIFITLIFFFLDYVGVLDATFFKKLLIIPISILMGLLATFYTKPTDLDQLKDFYFKVKPDGNWSIFEKKETFLSFKNIGNSFLFSFGIILMIYSIINISLGMFYVATIYGLIGIGIVLYLIKIKL